MNCLRCGKETQENQAFCEGCAAELAKHPVAPGTPVQIQKRPVRESENDAQQELSPEEANLQLRKLIRWLTAVIGAMTLVICILCAILFVNMSNQPTADDIGRNYNTVTPTQPE